MNKHVYKNYQAEVHFALATVIQGITVGYLGTAIAEIIKAPLNWPKMGLWILMASESLLLLTSFWYAFVMAYFHRFRIIEMSACTHMILAWLYFSIGIAQIVALQSLDNPHVWLTANLVMMVVISLYSCYMECLVGRNYSHTVSSYLSLKSFIRIEICILACLLVLLVPWHGIFPGLRLTTTTYTFIGLLVLLVVIILFNIWTVKLFQHRLNSVPNPDESAPNTTHHKKLTMPQVLIFLLGVLASSLWSILSSQKQKPDR